MQKKKSEIIKERIFLLIVLILVTIFGATLLLLIYYPEIKLKYLSTEVLDDSSIVASSEEIFYNKDSKPNKELYNILPGYTYYEDKGKMKLFADIIPTGNDNLMVSGVQYHLENFKDTLMKDATIKEVFYLQEDGSYKNKDNTITITLKNNLAEFKDTRVTVSMPYNGTLELVTAPEENLEVSNIDSGELFKDGLTIGNSKVEDIIVDSYDSSPTPDNYISGKNFTKNLTSDNERKDFTITAKYIESDNNSGVKYQELYTGTYFYTFGSGFPYDSNICNTVTITATYRGYNKRFNGLSMNDSYPCFVTVSIRKPNKQEVNP